MPAISRAMGRPSPSPTHLLSPVFITVLFFLSISVCALVLLLRPALYPPPHSLSFESPSTLRHLVFGLASSSSSLPRRSRFIRAWWRPNLLRGFIFLDSPLANASLLSDLPSIRVSEDSSRFPYAFPRRGGLKSAVRVARVVKEVVEAAAAMGGARWVVLGDDDTVFFPDNLLASLRRRDWRQWVYVGSGSESVEQNEEFSFEMAFGGGGFALSWPLAVALSRVLDSCLVRYAHLYGSDERIFSCLAELGVPLTPDAGFHQLDLRGDIFGLLAAHPLTPLISLHHLGSINPIFPDMESSEALEKLFTAVRVDPERILQQTVCYNKLARQTVSVSWGYAVQVFKGVHLLPEILLRQKTFSPWKRSRAASLSHYMFNTREFPRDPCSRPAVFFLERVVSSLGGSSSSYTRKSDGVDCLGNATSMNLKRVKVFSQLLSSGQSRKLEAPRRKCCDILPSSSDEEMKIKIRECGDELIAMS
ncbi:uncharacterized protein LOC144700095 [Wolffia australiana]